MTYWQRVIDKIKSKIHGQENSEQITEDNLVVDKFVETTEETSNENISELTNEKVVESEVEAIEDEEESFEKKASKEIRELMREEKYKEAKEKCKQFPDNEVIQSQLITILVKEKNIKEARTICQKFPENEIIQLQYQRVKEMKNNKYKNKQKSKIKKEEPKINKNQWMNIIKTRLHYDEIDAQFIEEIKQNKVELDEWRKTLALLAIYDKKKNFKMAEVTFKESKKVFAEDAEKIKTLNKVQNIVLSKKSKIFNAELFFELLHWQFDEKTKQEILAKRSAEKQDIKNEVNEVKEIAKKPEVKIEVPEPIKLVKEEPVKVSVHTENKPVNRPVKVKVKAKAKTPKVKENQPEQTIGEKFSKEVIELQAKILMQCGDITFDNSKLVVKDKGEKVSEEVFSNLKSTYDRQKELRKELEFLEEKVATKSAGDLRGKLQLIMLLRQYGMKEVADNKLQAESEIFDDIYEMCKFKRTSSEYAAREKKIRNSMTKIEGNKQSAYEFLDKVRER